jgi:excinuclease ABC subunit B
VALIDGIKAELEAAAGAHRANKLVEAQRLEQRTRFDLEMMQEAGLLQRHRELFPAPVRARAGRTAADSVRLPAARTPCWSSTRATSRFRRSGRCTRATARARKPWSSYGFRLPSALDNRPLRSRSGRSSPADPLRVRDARPYEMEHPGSGRAGGAPDRLGRSEVEVRPAGTQVDDVLSKSAAGRAQRTGAGHDA